MLKHVLLAAAVVSVVAGAPPPAAADPRFISAYDPELHVKPPTMIGRDGYSHELVLNRDFFERAARLRAENPVRHYQVRPEVFTVGEVLIVQGDDQLLNFDGVGFGLRQQALPLLAQRVIAKSGDNFQAMTVWTTFEDRASREAEAYELTIKNDVQGLGPSMILRDQSAAFGSNGVLRSMLNMKNVALTAGDSMQTWRRALTTWGQEIAHRWLAFFHFRDPRTGRSSDAMLGRGCSHYSRYLETQASVHDGLAWTDNGNGTFTWSEREARYSNLDLYGMGLLHPDEVPPWFMIDEVPGYRYPATCNEYQYTTAAPPRTVNGKRLDIFIEDVLAANGPRVPGADETQDYWREVQVILTASNETVQAPRVQALAERVNRARIFWEEWNKEATRNRLLICTQASGDCGDMRSDVSFLAFNAARQPPSSGPLLVEVDIANGGGRPTTGIKATFEVHSDGKELKKEVRDIPTLEPATARREHFNVDLRRVACGTVLDVKVSTQSSVHYSRRKTTELLGAEPRFTDGFEAESGWTVNPDGDDSVTTAQWERGAPERTELLRRQVQVGQAHGGQSAFVTGLGARSAGGRAMVVSAGKATLQSPPYDAAGLRDPALRYWVSFTGVRGDPTGQTLETSEQSHMVVQARTLEAAGNTGGAWVEIDRLANLITPGWVQRTVLLPKEVQGKPRLQLRFVAVDANPTSGAVEAAIDDVEVTSNNPVCYTNPPPGDDEGGCGCHLGSYSRPSLAPLALLVAAAILYRRRSRR